MVSNWKNVATLNGARAPRTVSILLNLDIAAGSGLIISLFGAAVHRAAATASAAASAAAAAAVAAATTVKLMLLLTSRYLK